jgi:hypothetical protein
MAQQRPYPITLDERRLSTLLRQPICDQRMAGKGHEDAFPRPRLSARCRFSQGTFAGTLGNGRDALIAAVPEATIELAAADKVLNQRSSGSPMGEVSTDLIRASAWMLRRKPASMVPGNFILETNSPRPCRWRASSPRSNRPDPVVA